MTDLLVNPNFATRMEATIRHVNAFLTFYKTPSQFYNVDGEEDQRKVAAWHKLIAETINSQIDGSLHDDAFKARLKEITAHLAKSFRGREWPSPHDFEQATFAIGKKAASQPGNRSVQATDIDPDQLAAKRILEGKPVGDYYITGPGYDRLIEKSLVTADDTRPYLEYIERETVKIYG